MILKGALFNAPFFRADFALLGLGNLSLQISI
jgi:hypothetical protein